MTKQTNKLISPLSGLRRLIESDQIDAPEDFLKDKSFVWSPHNKIINVTPGPAFGSELVTQFTSTQTRGMRGPGVAEFFTTVRQQYGEMVGLQEGGKALFFTGSGTSATEAAVGALRTPDEATSDKKVIITLEVGWFSRAMGNCVENLDRSVIRLKGELGEDLPLDQCRELLEKDTEGNIKMVMAPQNETGAGVTTDPKKIRDLLDELKHPALLVIDGISSIGSMPCSMTKMGIDILVGCSQKGMMGTPGIGMITLSPKAVQKIRESEKQMEDAGLKKGQHYLNLGKMIDAMEANGLHIETPGNYAQFAVALDAIAIEGIDRVCARHRECSEIYRAAVQAAGLELVAKNINTASNAVTAIKAPEGYGEKEIMQVLSIMFNKHAVEAAGIPGFPDMGWRLCATGGIQPQHALMASIAFLKSAEEAGIPIDSDKGIAAASKTYGEVVQYHRPLPGIDVYGR
jgi:alanine-glyoxylate transaminase/serine-glyoxylate transaminase/serine-pyruvate transaminase|tara:strand:- start:3511 stop:4887 length:1377 start_codon:yes stop_codon:yes gene_type:complete